MHIIVKELSGNRLEDTDKFLKAIVDAMNWEIAVMNGTMTLLNEENSVWIKTHSIRKCWSLELQ